MLRALCFRMMEGFFSIMSGINRKNYNRVKREFLEGKGVNLGEVGWKGEISNDEKLHDEGDSRLFSRH